MCQPKNGIASFDTFRKRSAFLNRAGFALSAVGTLLRLLAAW